MYETHLTVIGTLITAVNRRRLADDTTVASFRVASNERRFDRAAGTWTDGDSLYVSVTCWRQLAENVYVTFNLGDPIIVRGRLHSRSYEDKDGRRQTVIEMEALAVGPDLTRATAKVTRLRRDGNPSVVSSREPADTTADDIQRDAAELSDGPTSDDPWATTGTAADRRSSSDLDEGTLDEAAVGA